MSESSDRDRNFILTPREWPNIVLPLVRKGGECAVFAPSLAITHIKPDAPIEILIGNMFDKLSELPTKRYENVDALLADGWKVD